MLAPLQEGRLTASPGGPAGGPGPALCLPLKIQGSMVNQSSALLVPASPPVQCGGHTSGSPKALQATAFQEF